MNINTQSFMDDLRVPLHWIILGEIGISLCLFIVAGFTHDPTLQMRFRLFRIALFLLPFATWLLDRWKTSLARWVTVIGIAVVLEFAGLSLGITSLVTLSFLPVILAAS
jgi:hypothetical protein